MSTMYITEYTELATDKRGNAVQAGLDKGSTTQKVEFTATAGQSAAFQKGTKFIRISCDGAGYLAFGDNPTAVTLEGTPVQANTPEFFGVTSEQKVSAVT